MVISTPLVLIYPTWSVPLITWRHKKLEHQNLLHWPNSPVIFLPRRHKDSFKRTVYLFSIQYTASYSQKQWHHWRWTSHFGLCPAGFVDNDNVDEMWLILPCDNNVAWWRHQMEPFSALLALCAGNSPDAQRPVTRSFDVFFDLRLNKRLSKRPWGWWFETPPWSSWRQCNSFSRVWLLFCGSTYLGNIW